MTGQSQWTKLSIQCIQQKNLLLAQIKSASLPEQQSGLTQLLINIKCKRQPLCARQNRLESTKTEFSVNPKKAGKNLGIPNATVVYTLIKKSSNLFDKSYNIPMGNLEDLSPVPLFQNNQ